jgi:hypothetical protein
MAATLPAVVPDLIETTFAHAGTQAKPPQTDPNGFVNFSDGYSADYEIDLDSGNTEAKAVERADQNYLFGQSTVMAQWWQSMGLSPWYSTMANGGVAGYNAGALVGRVSTTTNEWVIWRSLVDANTVDPNTTNQTTWDYVPTDSDLATMFAMPAGGTGHKLLPGGQTTEQILTATDFNTLVTGTFEYVTDAIANGSANTPSAYAGMVECKLWSNTTGGTTTTYGVQRYYDRTGSTVARGMQNGTWTAWSSNTLTRAAIIAALGYTPANQATTITANNGLTGGGDLSANRTIGLAPIGASSLLANATGASAVPVACALLNGIVLNSPANTLGLGTITPANVASSGFVNGTTGTYSGSVSCAGLTSTAALSGTTASFSGALSAAGLTLTGALSGTTASFSGAATVNGLTSNSNITSTGNIVSTGGNVTSTGAFISSTANVVLSGTGAGIVLLRPNGSASSTGQVTVSSNGQLAGSTGSATPAASLTSQGSTTTLNLIDTGSNGCGVLMTGSGSTTPNKYLRVLSGNFNIVNSAYSAVILTLTDTGVLTTAGTIQPGSDGRVKKNRKKITNALSEVAKLSGLIYERSDRKNEIESGFIAQNVERHFPHLVTKNKEIGGLKNFRTLNYNGIIPYLANAINELHANVSKTFRAIYVDMRRELRERDKKIASLERRLEKLEKAMR